MTTDNPFSTRQLSAVNFSHFVQRTEGDATTIQATVDIVITNEHGGDGPGATATFAVTVDHTISLQDARLAVLDRALLLLRRIAEESPESLHAAWNRANHIAE